MKYIAAIIIIFLIGIKLLQAQYTVNSPNQRSHFSINALKDGKIIGEIFWGNLKVLSIQIVNFKFGNTMPDLEKNLAIMGVKTSTKSEVWTPVLKRYTEVQNNYNEITLEIQEAVFPKRKLQVTARAYDDGIAYRLNFLGPDHGIDYKISEENTMFSFDEDHLCWAADHRKFISPQESLFQKLNISELSPGMLIGLPLTMKISDDCYASVTEAGLSDYSGFYLKKNDMNKLTLKSVLAPGIDNQQDAKVTRKVPFETPWRVVILGDAPGKLIESELVCNLNPSCAIQDPSWIKPGISAWDNWFSRDVKMEPETIKEFIDLASEMGWPYMLVDWQWYGEYNKPEADITKAAPNLNMQELIRYAKEKNVRLFLWLYWTDVNRSNWDSVCALYHQWGIAGVKIDFMNRDDQEMVNWYEKIVKTAAKHKLLIDFHGAYKPTGLRRTYPNLVTREGVLGNEWNKWSLMVTPEHICTIPFTRMLAGPMDFTPGCFINKTPDQFKIGRPTNSMVTRSNTLAQFVVFDSPLTVACDHPDNYRGQTGIEFLKKVKTVWDDTKVLNGSIGDYITMVRRYEKTWFIGALNSSESRKISIPLDFLPDGSSYKMISFEDGHSPDQVIRKENVVTKSSVLSISLAPGGGFAAYFEPIK